MSLSLTFAEGRVSGTGADVVGRFGFDGTYDLGDGRVRMTKNYQNAHSVGYDGANQDDGMWLWGVWAVGPDRGGFHLWPEGEDDPTQRRLRKEREAPAPKSERRVVLEPVGAGLPDDHLPGPDHVGVQRWGNAFRSGDSAERDLWRAKGCACKLPRRFDVRGMSCQTIS